MDSSSANVNISLIDKHSVMSVNVHSSKSSGTDNGGSTSNPLTVVLPHFHYPNSRGSVLNGFLFQSLVAFNCAFHRLVNS